MGRAMNILLDTGFMVALLVKNDKYHSQAVAILGGVKASVNNYHTVWECLTEACHKLSNDKRQALIKWLVAVDAKIHATKQEDLLKIADYMAKYANVSKGKGADLADVSLVLLADKIKTVNILTVDRADFETYRTLSGKPFKRLWLKE